MLRGWRDPITKEEVLACFRRGEEKLTKTPLALKLSVSDKPMDLPLLRENHIKKIAYFVKHEPMQKFWLDVGMASTGCFFGYFIQDGNHHFSGSIIAERDSIACGISGGLVAHQGAGAVAPERGVRVFGWAVSEAMH